MNTPYGLDEKDPDYAERKKLFDEFVAKTGVWLAELTEYAVTRIVNQFCVADPDRKKAVRESIYQAATAQWPLDHADMWWRGPRGFGQPLERHPVAITAHLYGVDDRAREFLDGLRDVGLQVTMSDRSWYGQATTFVVIHGAGFWRKPWD